MPNGVCPFASWIPGVTVHGGRAEERVGFCDHTAGGFYRTLSSARFWNDQGYGVHFAIGRAGETAQMVNIFDIAWGQGRDSRGLEVGPESPGVTWPPFAAMGKRNPNFYLISTEHEDAETIEGRTVFVPGRQWTEAQYRADLRVKQWCRQEVKRVLGQDVLAFGPDSLAGHYMFDPVNRKECPGLFWREEYKSRLYRDLTATSEEPRMIRHNTVSISLGGKGAGHYKLADFDHPPPSSARVVRLEVFLAANLHGLTVRDGSGAYAGQVGWDGARYGTVDVDVTAGEFILEGDGVLEVLGIVGYWN